MSPERLAEIGHFLDNSHGLQRQHRELAKELYASLRVFVVPPIAEAEQEPEPIEADVAPAPADSSEMVVEVVMGDEVAPFDRSVVRGGGLTYWPKDEEKS